MNYIAVKEVSACVEASHYMSKGDETIWWRWQGLIMEITKGQHWCVTNLQILSHTVHYTPHSKKYSISFFPQPRASILSPHSTCLTYWWNLLHSPLKLKVFLSLHFICWSKCVLTKCKLEDHPHLRVCSQSSLTSPWGS